jgi:hypothetical protein
LNVDPITTVIPEGYEKSTPIKSKSKTVAKSRSKYKPKRGESKIPLTMHDLVFSDDSSKINSKVESNVEASDKDADVSNVEASDKSSVRVSPSPGVEKGNVNETLTADIPKSAENLGLDDLVAAVDMGVNNTSVNHDIGVTPAEEDVDKSTRLTPDKTATSLGQQPPQVDGDDSGFHTANEHDNVSDGTGGKADGVNEEIVQDSPEKVVAEDEGESVEKEKVVVVDVDDMTDDIPLAKTFNSQMAKRLRSSKGKSAGAAVVATVVETPKSKKKDVSVGPTKAWSKVIPKPTASKSKKRKAVSSGDSDYDVEEDVPNIHVSAVKVLTVKKSAPTVSYVPTDRVSFHYPEYAQRWKYVFHRRLALERELGEDALKITDVIDLIKEAGLLKTVTKLGDCYEVLVKEFLVNIPEDCDNPLSLDYQTVYVRGE